MMKNELVIDFDFECKDSASTGLLQAQQTKIKMSKITTY
jgi:hypothetical protein